MFVSPDAGGVVRARKFADMFHADIAIVDKMRPEAGKSEVMNLIGDVKGKHAILVDDIIDSGGTLCNAAKAIMDAGALSVRAYITHGVLSDEACQKVEKSVLTELVVTRFRLQTVVLKTVKRHDRLVSRLCLVKLSVG